MHPFMHCHICRDKKTFDSKMQDARRILYRLKELRYLVPRDFELSKEDRFQARRIHYESHLHFMCGHCPKANLHELHRIEEELLIEAYRLYAFAKDTEEKNIKGKIKSDCQRLLSGFYPNIATLFYRRL